MSTTTSEVTGYPAESMRPVHGWQPVAAPFVVKAAGVDIDEWFPKDTGRQFELAPDSFVVGVRTSRRVAMLAGRKVALTALAGLPSRECQRLHARGAA